MTQRVELKPHLDMWMRGARYGTIISARNETRITARNGRAVAVPVVTVALDRLPNKKFKFFVDDLTYLNAEENT